MSHLPARLFRPTPTPHPGSPRATWSGRAWVMVGSASLALWGFPPQEPLAAQSPRARHGSGAVTPPETRLVRSSFAMGTVLRVEIADPMPRPLALSASEAAVEAVEATEALLSTWRRESPLSGLNRAPVGDTLPVPPALLAVLETAFHWIPRTGGAFDPRLGALVDAWELRGSGRIPAPEALAGALSATGDTGVTLSAGRLVRHHPASWVDAGGFGKGAALTAAARALRGHGVQRALVDLGGQLLAVGSPEPGGEGWPVAVAHPFERGRPVAELLVRGASVATSGTSERGIEVGDVRFGHLLDPRTGRPSPAWGSVTVVSSDALEADILATALYVMGPQAGMAFAQNLPDTGVLFLRASADILDARWNPAMERWLVAPPSNPTADLPDPRIKPNEP